MLLDLRDTLVLSRHKSFRAALVGEDLIGDAVLGSSQRKGVFPITFKYAVKRFSGFRMLRKLARVLGQLLLNHSGKCLDIFSGRLPVS